MVRQDVIEQMVSWRHHLHQYPETAMKETQTAEYVASILRVYGYTVEEHIGKTGVVGTLRKGNSNRMIALRSDMDALPIQEKTNLAYASENGCMHACGHDGHMAMLLGAAVLLAQDIEFDGTICLVFQPGEEATIGAKSMIEDGFFDCYPIQEIYGLHNVPFRPLGMIATRNGGIMTSEDNFVITVHGGGCHASTPHEGVDPILCFSQIYPALQSVVSREVNPTHSLVISCTEILTDGVRNAIPSTLTVRGDVRSFDRRDQMLVEKRMRDITASVCTLYGAEGKVEYCHETTPLINDPACVQYAAEAAVLTSGENFVDRACEPWMASEDFAYFLEKVPGCLVQLGVGNDSEAYIPLHSPQYNFNDEALKIGAEYWQNLVRVRLAPVKQ